MKRIIFTIVFALSLAFAYGQGENNPRRDQVKVYPNPASDQINIVIEQAHVSVKNISIHSIIGNKVPVVIENITGGVYKAKVEDLPPGYYLVVVKDQVKKINSTIKFLKK